MCLSAVCETGVAFAGVVGAAHETGIAFAGVVGAARETGVAFAGVVGAARETGIASAGVNAPVLGGWSRAVVSRVSSASVGRRVGMPRGCCWANFFARGCHGGITGRTFSRRDDARRPPQSADDGLLFGHADDAGALAKGEGRRHRHGAGTAREHEEDEDVLGADRQHRRNAGG